MNFLQDWEKQIDRKLRGLFRTSSDAHPVQGREMVELHRMVMEAVQGKVQQLPRARRVFPFDEVLVQIPAATEEKRIAAEMVFFEGDALKHDILHALGGDGVQFPENFQVEVQVVLTSELHDPVVVCRRSEPKIPAAKDAGAAKLEMPEVIFTTVDTGVTYAVRRGRIQLGRTADVLDEKNRPVRRNDVVVEHETVSRAHAHIEWDSDSGDLRLFDDGSSYGTGLLHDGKLQQVPSGGRGVRLHPGDEIYLGQARVRIDPA